MLCAVFDIERDELREDAVGGQPKYRATTLAVSGNATPGGCAIKVAIAGLQQRTMGIRAVVIVERDQGGQRAIGA